MTAEQILIGVAALVAGVLIIVHIVRPLIGGSSRRAEVPELPAEAREVPERFTIVPDAWQAKYVGTVVDDRRFYLHAAQLESGPATVVFFWRNDGSFESVDVEPFSDRDDYDEALERHLARLGSPSIGSITVAPFAVEHEGETVGFVPQEPDATDGDGIASVRLLPADNIVYYWPWDGEGYDT